MNNPLAKFLEDLYAYGVAYDLAQPNRLLKRRNLEPDTAGLLSLIVRIAGARTVVEIGTSNGYSTIWLADAVTDTDGHVISVDTAPIDEGRANVALADAAQAGLSARVELRQQDGGAYLAQLADESVDLLFLDAERVEYPNWWPHPARVLRRAASRRFVRAATCAARARSPDPPDSPMDRPDRAPPTAREPPFPGLVRMRMLRA